MKKEDIGISIGELISNLIRLEEYGIDYELEINSNLNSIKIRIDINDVRRDFYFALNDGVNGWNVDIEDLRRALERILAVYETSNPADILDELME